MKNPYAAPLTKWEREHADEAIEAIKAGYDWTKTKSCWSVTHRNNRNEALAEVSTRLVAVKIAVRLWQDDIRPA
jgi:hypothetical protein